MADSLSDKGAVKPAWPPGQIEGWDVSKLAPVTEPVRSKIILGPEAQYAHDQLAKLPRKVAVEKPTRRGRRRNRPY